MRPSAHVAAMLFAGREITGAEVGVSHGENAFAMLAEWEGLHRLILVEIDRDLESVIRERLRDHDDHYTLVFGDSATVGQEFSEETFDYVYLDADHGYEGVRRDLESWYPRVKHGGMLAGHDYSVNLDDGVTRAVHEFFRAHHMSLTVSGIDWWGIRHAE